MSLATLVLVGFITAAEFFYILRCLDEDIFLTALGYKAYVDAVFGLGTTIYFAISGTISGVVIAAFAGLMFSICLYITAKLFGSRKRVKGEWVRYDPEWDLKAIFAKVTSQFTGATTNVQ